MSLTVLETSTSPGSASAAARLIARAGPHPSHPNVRFAGGYMLSLRLEECGRREVLLRVRSAPRLGFPAD
jgi:hypothetical protein